jgi:hypothetical protein
MVDRVSLEPGKTGSTKNYGLTTASLVKLARESNSLMIHFQVGVLAVRFQDGTEWKSKLQEGQTFSTDLLGREGKKCSGGKLQLQQAKCLNCVKTASTENTSSETQLLDPSW